MESVRRKLLQNPRNTASKLSNLLSIWTINIFKKGYQRTLDITDLYDTLAEDRSSNLGDRLEFSWNKQRKCLKSRPSLVKAVATTFWKNYLYLGLICVLNDIIIRLSQPYLLGRFLIYLRKDSTMSFSNALFYGLSIIFLNALNIMAGNQYIIGCFHVGMKVRVALCSIIYRKALKVSQTSLRETVVLNLLTNDASRFDWISSLVHSMWSAPLMIIIIGYLLWDEARWAGMIGIAVLFLIVPIQWYTGKLSSKYRLRTAQQTDERIKLMDEIISSVRVIKLFGWETPFSKMINSARKKELNSLRKNSYVRGLYMTITLFTTRIALFCTMLSICVIYGRENISASKIFVIAAYFNLLAHAMSQMFAQGIGELAEAYISVKRLQNFLELDEIKENIKESGDGRPLSQKIAISVTNLTASWNIESKDRMSDEKNIVSTNYTGQLLHTLNQISMNIKRGALIGILGPVGAGKSSFLQALLSELPLESGSMNINGSISYANQEPWIFSGSVRQNVVFSNSFDATRYELVLRSCALNVDIDQFKCGDKMIIGDKGISLSGGQKARVNLARCVYRKSDIYLLDDPLSAVDSHVGRHLFDECIGPNGFLAKSGCTRILVTHQVHFLKDADFLVVFRNGRTDFQGTPTELSNLGIDFSEFLQMNRDEVDKVANDIPTQTEKNTEKHNVQDVYHEKVAELENISKSTADESVFRTYFRSGANYCVLLSVSTLFIVSQILASASDYWVAFWTGQEESRNVYLKELLNEPISNGTATVIQIVNFTQTIDFSNNLLTTQKCAFIHGTLITTLLIVAITRRFIPSDAWETTNGPLKKSISFYTVCIRASHTLHNAMFKGIISTALRFFETNPTGRILNLFAKDLGTIDESLPKTLLGASQSILIITGSITLTIIVRPIFTIPILLIGMVFIYARKIYLNASKDIKRMEGTTRSPVFTHLSATMHGLSTIRALKAQDVLTEEFDNHQDLHSSCWFMFISTSSAFGFCLDFLCFLVVSCIVSIFLLSGQISLGNEVGLALTQIMTLTGMLRWCIRQSAEVSNHLMSVERVIQYRELPPEKQPEKEHVGKEWPSSGKIEFKTVSYRYSEALQPVLTNLNFVIQPKEKIGICGRTGAGKSSLIGALFRLAVIEGDILIDGVNTNKVNLNQLRSNISIIPQDPVLFSGTLRRNLDPFENYTDSDIWKALDDVELKHLASGPLGLQNIVWSGGCNFSVGEKQLLCLARALLQKSKILVADEATGNVSLSADQLIQQKIREKFVDCTVLTVAHRLNTIIDSDRILVMDNGRVIEFASPHELLNSKSGVFYNMIQALGQSEAAKLTKLAIRNKYKYF